MKQYSTKTADIQTILFNMHYLINQYRPHQARETLILQMEEQLERVRRETDENREATRRVDETLLKIDSLADQIKDTHPEEDRRRRPEDAAAEKARGRDLEGWDLLTSVF